MPLHGLRRDPARLGDIDIAATQEKQLADLTFGDGQLAFDGEVGAQPLEELGTRTESATGIGRHQALRPTAPNRGAQRVVVVACHGAQQRRFQAIYVKSGGIVCVIAAGRDYDRGRRPRAGRQVCAERMSGGSRIETVVCAENMSMPVIKREVTTSYDETLARVTEALRSEGFGVLTEIDVKHTLKQKIDVDFRRYKILGACNPALAHKALGCDLDVGVLLPCNVVVYENESGTIVVSAVDPVDAVGAFGADDLATIAVDVKERLQRAINSLV